MNAQDRARYPEFPQHTDHPTGSLDGQRPLDESPALEDGRFAGQSAGPAAAPASYGPVPRSARTDEDPGKVLGIVALVASLSTFLGFSILGPLVGIVTGHMSRTRSREVGLADNEMGKWGFLLGIVFIAIGIIGTVLGFSVAAVAGVVGLLGA